MTLSKRAAIVPAILLGIVAALVGSGVAMAQDGCTITVHADGIALDGCTVLTPTPAPTETPTETPTPAPTATATAARYPLGADWAGAMDGYYSDGALLHADGGGAILWRDRFDADQEVYVTLAGMAPNGRGMGLALLSQSAVGIEAGALGLRLTPAGALSAQAATTAGQWRQVGASVPTTVKPGDQLGARYMAGRLEGYVNGERVLSVAVAPAFDTTRGGWAGLVTDAAPGWVFDDFGAGALP